MLKYLRIAVTALGLTACVLLIALWVRSYGSWDRCFRTGKNHGWQLNSMLGHVVLVVAEPPKEFIPFFIAHLSTEGRFQGEFDKNILGFYFERTPQGMELDVPYWFMVLTGMAVTTAPWIRHLGWRFSLRTLLIATTLVAVVLGIVVAAN